MATDLEFAQEMVTFCQNRLREITQKSYDMTSSGNRRSKESLERDQVKKELGEWQREVARLSGTSRVNAGAPL